MENKYRCPTCKSENTVWRGYRYNKSGKRRLRKCNECNKKFSPDDGFLRMRKPKKAIVEAVALYNDGLSLSKVKNHLWQHHGVKVSRWMILRWVRKYSKLLGGYTSGLKPKIKGSIHSDEVIVKVKGENNWRWGSIDRITKFKFSGPLTEYRRKEGAICLYRRIKERAKNRPKKMISDKLGHYRIAYRKLFYRNRPPFVKMIHGVPIGCKKYGLKHNNNPIERDNESTKQRYKVMRGFKENSSASDILDLMDIFHNFINPHMGLKGKFPAECADIDLKLGRNRLRDLIFFNPNFYSDIELRLTNNLIPNNTP